VNAGVEVSVLSAVEQRSLGMLARAVSRGLALRTNVCPWPFGIIIDLLADDIEVQLGVPAARGLQMYHCKYR
jgi:hypothetical protein